MPPAAPQRHAGPAPSRAPAAKAVATTTVDRWRLLACEASAAPGFMTLRAVRDGGVVVDFVWDFASASAARLLRRPAAELVGERLLDGMRDLQGRALVFEQYRGVVERRTSDVGNHVHVVNGVEDHYRHAAVRLGDGVAVTLTNLSAVVRAHALRHAMVHNGMVRW